MRNIFILLTAFWATTYSVGAASNVTFKGQVLDSTGHSVEGAAIFVLQLAPKQSSSQASAANPAKPALTGMLAGKSDSTGAFSVSVPSTPPGGQSSSTGDRPFLFYVINSVTGEVGAGRVTLPSGSSSATVSDIELK